MINLNNRISFISKLINNANIVVDVGSDHAQLSKILIDENRAKKVINIEKNLKPYENSVNNTKNYTDRIENILSNGFLNFDKNIEIDYVTISGMGAKTMVDIICFCENSVKNIIFCSNNNEEILREFAKNNFYKIKKDLTILDNDVYYSLIWLSKTEGIKSKKKDYILGNLKLKKEDDNYEKYLINKISKIEKIKDIKLNNKKKYKELKQLKKRLKKWQYLNSIKN